MHKYLSLLLLILMSVSLCAEDSIPATKKQEKSPAKQSKIFQGFSGGMMVHMGYQYGHNNAPEFNHIKGATFGIGGAARVHLYKYLRVGAEGFFSTMPSWATNQRKNLSNGSYIQTGWGGALAEACWRGKVIWPYIGVTIGGGSCKTLYIIDGKQDDWKPETQTTFNKQSFFVFDPYIGVDWCMTSSIHLTFRFDWMIAAHKNSLLEPTGPRLYVGFMFGH